MSVFSLYAFPEIHRFNILHLDIYFLLIAAEQTEKILDFEIKIKFIDGLKDCFLGRIQMFGKRSGGSSTLLPSQRRSKQGSQ